MKSLIGVIVIIKISNYFLHGSSLDQSY